MRVAVAGAEQDVFDLYDHQSRLIAGSVGVGALVFAATLSILRLRRRRRTRSR